jgi:hypothetical protein
MSQQSNPAPREMAEAVMPSSRAPGYSGSRKGRPSGNSARGRLFLVLIFLVLRLGDALVYFGGPSSAKSQLLAGVLTGALWTTALLAGVWFRQDWCRWALMVALIACIFASAAFLRAAFDLPLNYRLMSILLAVAAINGGAAWAVIALRDIRRVTSRAYGSRPYGY